MNSMDLQFIREIRETKNGIVQFGSKSVRKSKITKLLSMHWSNHLMWISTCACRIHVLILWQTRPRQRSPRQTRLRHFWVFSPRQTRPSHSLAFIKSVSVMMNMHAWGPSEKTLLWNPLSMSKLLPSVSKSTSKTGTTFLCIFGGMSCLTWSTTRHKAKLLILMEETHSMENRTSIHSLRRIYLTGILNLDTLVTRLTPIAMWFQNRMQHLLKFSQKGSQQETHTVLSVLNFINL